MTREEVKDKLLNDIHALMMNNCHVHPLDAMSALSTELSSIAIAIGNFYVPKNQYEETPTTPKPSDSSSTGANK